MEGILSLLKSRKVLIALLAVAAKVGLHYFPEMPADIWQAVENLAMVLIGAIAVEDAAAKLGLSNEPNLTGRIEK